MEYINRRSVDLGQGNRMKWKCFALAGHKYLIFYFRVIILRSIYFMKNIPKK